MGLFDFAKNIGEKLFNKDDEAAEKITQRIGILKPGIDNLKVTFNDGVVTLTGETKSDSARQKAVLISGNVKGVEKVVADDLVVLEAEEEAEEAGEVEATEVEYYEIKSGDTLGKIAQNFYGKASAYPKIFEANREVIKDADKIYPGQKIRIPKLVP